MATTKQSGSASRRNWSTDYLGIGNQRPARRKEKSTSLCDEQGCDKPIVYWLKFHSGRLGFYCQHHKELFEKWGILARVERAEREGE